VPEKPYYFKYLALGAYKYFIVFSVCYLFTVLFLTNVNSPAQGYFYAQKIFSRWTGVNMFLNGMFAGRDNVIGETRIVYSFNDKTYLAETGRVYRWNYTRDPFIFTKARLSNPGYLHIGNSLKNGYGTYYCNNDSKIFKSQVSSIRMQTRIIDVQKLYPSIEPNHILPVYSDWSTRWEVTCD
jgi:hypothetical protein